MNSQSNGNKKTDSQTRSDGQPLSQLRGDTRQIRWLDEGRHDIEDACNIDSRIQAGLFQDKITSSLQKKSEETANQETNQTEKSHLERTFFIKHVIEIIRNGDEIPSHKEKSRDSHAREDQNKSRNQEGNQKIKRKEGI